MKKYMLAILVVVCGSAFAAPVVGPSGERFDAGWPDRVIGLDGHPIDSPSEETCVSLGYSLASDEQISAWAAQDEVEQAAQAELDAAPERFDNGIVSGNGLVFLPATPGGSNGWAVAVDTNGNLISSHWYGSPTSTVAEIRADLAAKSQSNAALRAAARAAKAMGGGLPAQAARLNALEAMLGVELP